MTKTGQMKQLTELELVGRWVGGDPRQLGTRAPSPALRGDNRAASSTMASGRAGASLTQPELRGVLLKKHQHSRAMLNWGRRYFEVDDERGILCYFRTRAAQDWDEPARHFTISALVHARLVDDPSGPHAFELAYLTTGNDDGDDDAVAFGPGVYGERGAMRRLLLRAESEAERERWVNGLQARIRRRHDRYYHGGTSPPTVLRPGGPALADSSATAVAAASAAASATLAAQRAAARASSAASAEDICLAMGALERPSSASPAGSRLSQTSLRGGRLAGQAAGSAGSASGMSAGRRRQHIDIATFLEMRQAEVLAELEQERLLLDSLPHRGGGGGRQLARPSSAYASSSPRTTAGFSSTSYTSFEDDLPLEADPDLLFHSRHDSRQDSPHGSSSSSSPLSSPNGGSSYHSSGNAWVGGHAPPGSQAAHSSTAAAHSGGSGHALGAGVSLVRGQRMIAGIGRGEPRPRERPRYVEMHMHVYAFTCSICRGSPRPRGRPGAAAAIGCTHTRTCTQAYTYMHIQVGRRHRRLGRRAPLCVRKRLLAVQPQQRCRR